MSNNSNNIYNILGKLEALKPTAQEKHDATVKAIYESVEAQGSIIEGVDAIQAKLAQQFAESIDEKAPPGAKAERMVKGIKKSLSKDGHLSDKDKAIAYATTWKAHNKGQVEEGCTCNEGACAMHEESEQFHSDRVALLGKVNKVIQGIQTPEQYKNSLGFVKRAFQKLNDQPGGPEFSSKAIQRIQQDASALKADLDAKAKELGIEPQHFLEAEITRKPGVTTHRKTDFPGYPADDINDPDAEPTDRKRGRPRKHAAKAPTGLGRGRPVKAKAPTFSKQADPFGRVSGAVPKGEKGKVHTMAESMNRLERRLIEGVNFQKMAEETNQTIDELMNDLQNDIKEYKATGHCSDILKDFMQVHAHSKKQVAAEAGIGHDLVSPEQRVAQATPQKPGIMGAVKDVAQGASNWLQGKPETGATYEEVTMEDELNELARLAGVTTSEGNAFTGKLKDTPKGSEFELDGKTFKDTSSLGEADLEEESPKADKDYDQDGEVESEKDEVIGSRRKAAGLDESTSFDGGDSSDFNISTNMSSDGDKNVTVTATGEHAATLLQMLRIAGLGGSDAAQALQQPQAEPEMGDAEVVVIGEPEEVMDEEGIEVDHPAQEPANAPHEKYGTIKNITTQGDDMNREKSQDPATANKAANPMTNAQGVLKAVAQLESKLAEEYESIKKVSK